MIHKLSGRISFAGRFQTRTQILTWIYDYNADPFSHIEVSKVGHTYVEIKITTEEGSGMERQFRALYNFLESLPKFRSFDYECWEKVCIER